MTKQDVLDAINATMVPNGIKAINADSIRNLLTMMLDFVGEAGSGSGDGALRVIVPETMMLGLMIAEAGELSPTSWAAMRPELEASLGGVDLSEYEAVVNAAFTHNADIAEQIYAKAQAGQGVSVVLDQTPYGLAIFSVLPAIDPAAAALMEGGVFAGVQPAGLQLVYQKYTAEGEAAMGVSEVFECILVPVGGVYDDNLGQVNYLSDVLIILQRDGSLFFQKAGSETETTE